MEQLATAEASLRTQLAQTTDELQAAEAAHADEISLQREKHAKLKEDATEELELARETHQVD
eukprot:COSAG05_NODE_1505_length_4691_cov_73.111498_8_plen_62_part_00